MPRTCPPRRLVALIAAYGLALQALLSAFAAVVPAGALDWVVCSADGQARGGEGDRNDSPAPGHGPDCAVCPLVCGSAAPLPSSDIQVVLMLGSGAALPEQHLAGLVAPAVIHAGLARAPPA
jgi:hypothetical protein